MIKRLLLFSTIILVNSSAHGAQPEVPKQEQIDAKQEAKTLKMGNFSWITDDKNIGGMRYPGKDILTILQNKLNVGLVITLTEDPLDESLRSEFKSITFFHSPIRDFQVPSLEQQLAFVEAIKKTHAQGKACVVHCLAGRGRTGTMLATWLVSQGMDPAAAIIEVRSKRPGSIETPAQEGSIHDFSEYLKKEKQKEQAQQQEEASSPALTEQLGELSLE